MRKIIVIILLILLTGIMPLNHVHAADQQEIKILDIESNNLILETDSSAIIDREVKKALKSIKNITVQANPLPQIGYLIKIPLTSSIKVKNKWLEEYITEVLFVYNMEDNSQSRLILYNDENIPIFFDIQFDFTTLFNELKFEINE
ncbi:MAG TPA: hypothetical protein VEY70_01915 [Metabacillus sp.]|nr:hypothetical protein [Metabacillus sp.]